MIDPVHDSSESMALTKAESENKYSMSYMEPVAQKYTRKQLHDISSSP